MRTCAVYACLVEGSEARPSSGRSCAEVATTMGHHIAPPQPELTPRALQGYGEALRRRSGQAQVATSQPAGARIKDGLEVVGQLALPLPLLPCHTGWWWLPTAGGIYRRAKGEGRPARAPCTLRAPRHARHSATTTYYAARRTCGEGRGPCEEDGLLERPRLGGGLLRGQHHRAHPTDDVLPALGLGL